ncbi:DUF4019 domain-containing protein [Burkholderia ubonensis]|uniref:DUF4019 domain-containing protein n=1 Tax=Burkholderia ubonensis TaxID=101571 RepID=UPI0039F59DEF
MLNSASTLLQRIDAGRDDELWKSTAEFVRSTMSQEKFSSAIKQARQSVGAVAKRSWASVSRLEFAAGGGGAQRAVCQYRLCHHAGRRPYRL